MADGLWAAVSPHLSRHRGDLGYITALFLVSFVVNAIHPAQPFITRAEMEADHAHPFASHNTIPSWTVPVLAIVPPGATFATVYWSQGRGGAPRFSAAATGLLASCAVAHLVTDTLKVNPKP